MWGWELIVDAKGCRKETLTKENIAEFTRCLVEQIKMKAYGEPMIEHFANHDPSKGGYSLVQLIETSNICAHFVDLNGDAYFNIFSCAEFSENTVIRIINLYFNPHAMTSKMIERG